MKNHTNTVRLIELMNEYQVDGPAVASLMGRALKTVHCWRSGSSLISHDMLDLLEMRLIRMKRPELLHRPNTLFGWLADVCSKLDSADFDKFCRNCIACQGDQLTDAQREMLAGIALVALNSHGVKTTREHLCQLMGLKELQTRKTSGSTL